MSTADVHAVDVVDAIRKVVSVELRRGGCLRARAVLKLR